jgi:FMN phosphatase YigB (HAD superfamily)
VSPPAACFPGQELTELTIHPARYHNRAGDIYRETIMPITLLLDLDDTLLSTNMDVFIPAYFKALSVALADKVAPEVMLPALTNGTKQMMTAMDPAVTLKEVFDSYFFPPLGLERHLLQADIDHFYDQQFPSLGSLTKPIPGAVEFVEWAFEMGHRVVIATNPFFPLKAVQHRLRWAGLPPEKYPFALVTSYETFHFTKEMVAYYPEIMTQLGWPDGPVLVAGDDLQREVTPSRSAGFPIYLVRTNGRMKDDPEDIPQGRLADCRSWLEQVQPESLSISLKSPAAILANLRATPAGISTYLKGLPEDAWRVSPAPGEWCLTEVACHLRDVEREVYQFRIRKVLQENDPFLAGISTDEWVSERRCAEEDGVQALHDFVAARKETLQMLDTLEVEWNRSSRHAIFGPTSLLELARFMVEHDRAHVQQAWKTRP